MVSAGQAAVSANEIPVASNDIETSTISQEEPVEIGQEIVRLRIPALKIKRAVIDIGLVDGPNGMIWDTNHLFANRNRSDLVGHLEGSAYPGEGGNIVLVGHNYNFTVNGVFVNLQNLEKGDKLILTTESGLEREYQVVKVKSLPWLAGSAEEIKNHFRFLGPSDGEQLTLVTCGGANIGIFNRRVYVVAVPLN
jgi:LPXTG-site transpeptidase (sortase) family protein